MRFVALATDVAALLSASRSVAAKHVALRSRQIDAYRRTWEATANRPETSQSEPPLARSGGKADEPPVQPAESPLKDTEVSSTAAHASTPESPDAQPEAPVAQPKPSSGGLGAEDASAAYARASQKRQEALRAAAEQRHVTGDINVNIFHTSHGSTILGSLRKREGTAAKKGQAGGPAKEHPLRYWPHSPSPPPPPQVAPQAQTPEPAETKPILEQDDVVAHKITLPPAEEPAPHSDAPEADAEPRKADSEVAEPPQAVAQAAAPFNAATPAYTLRESKVPASRLSRLWNYGGLAAGMLGGAVTEGVSRALGGGDGGQGSALLSGRNMERMVAKLSRMRGAALKLGQMLSFQDSKMLPGPIQEVLQRVQDRADYMPGWQRDKVLASNLGSDWRALFGEFEEKPIAAASIGQVHQATLKSTGKKVAVKIQFPGVADSINSDLDNLGILLNATKLLPKGLYLDKTIDNARLELGWECDYEREARCALRYRRLLRDEGAVFLAPDVHPEASGKQVLTMDFMDGASVTRVASFTQQQRDWIGTQIMRLCLREITEFKFMQTDPNWTNFLYDAGANKLVLLDFGASREYPDDFVRQYVRLLDAASRSDRPAVKHLSESLGYLTGHESRAMLDAHTQSVLTLAEPFMRSAPDVYDFEDQTITARVKALIPVMLRERLAPPPEETYSLHRKLSGAFLLCARLGSKVPCKELFAQSVGRSGYV
ncbi:uncharacterized protein UV8b_03145 [Ustilaginoidea virens]|uniref:ABC1 atypical kinase-like domain-containing protein n=1 Tax=Ustilaginoidea virens TaxID=1159556 RepID=A0A063C648_USTVR|nr:uncharacterized protein UV8b_03145 [Ustilaginoidea virens]QUC18904.1 hypothetical protein UV8b_03145 [Ustilaginoidea virens]GAO17039.1 hypothetical protein UVI_02021870 [Ustilaginoidea virens]